MADIIFNAFKANIMNGTIDLDTDDIYVMLTTDAFTPTEDSMEFVNEVTNEVSGTGYTAAGQILAGGAVTADDTDDEGVFDADDLTWASSTITARYAVLYKKVANTTESPLICCIDFAADKSSSNGDFKIAWNAEGILNLN